MIARPPPARHDERFDRCEACGRFRELIAREMYAAEREDIELGWLDLGEAGA